MLTSLGYSQTTGNEDAMNVMGTKLSCINDEFTLYWALKCASAPLLPGPFSIRRDKELETANKSKVLQNIPNLAQFLVKSEISGEDNNAGGPLSELLLMVTSNILESVLVSYRDTTGQEDFLLLIDKLSKG